MNKWAALAIVTLVAGYLIGQTYGANRGRDGMVATGINAVGIPAGGAAVVKGDDGKWYVISSDGSATKAGITGRPSNL